MTQAQESCVRLAGSVGSRPRSASIRTRWSSARSCTPREPSPSSGCRRTSCGRATSSASTCSGTAIASCRSTRNETRGASARRPTRSLSDIPFHVDVVDVFRAPQFVPAIADEAVEIGADALWLQFGVISAEGARIAERGRAESGRGPLHEGRARAPHGTHALAGLQHRHGRRPAPVHALAGRASGQGAPEEPGAVGVSDASG